jgi:hypothetical protein
MSTVPNFNFCIPALSSPSCDDPNTTTFALLPSFAFAIFAKLSAEAANNEPGFPT